MKTHAFPATVAVAAFFCGLVPSVSATDFFVNNTLGDTSAGSLRRAVEQTTLTSGPHRIALGGVAGEIVLSGPVAVITEDVEIIGPGADVLTVTAAPGERLFSGAIGTSISLTAFSVKGGGGASPGPGAAALALGDLTLKDIHAHGFSGSQGGAFWCSGTLTAETSTFSNNEATGHGGAVTATGTSHFFRCTFSGNRAGTRGGGAAVVGNGTSRFIHCTFYENDAQTAGGAVDTTGNDTGMRNCLVARNTLAGRLGTDSQISGGVDFSDPADHNLTEPDHELMPLRSFGQALPYHLPRIPSSAIDGAEPAATVFPGTDVRGTKVPTGDFSDVGAVEVNLITVNTASDNDLDTAIDISNNSSLDRLDYIVLAPPAPGASASISLGGPLRRMLRGSIIVGRRDLTHTDVAIVGASGIRLLEFLPGSHGGFDRIVLTDGDPGGEAGALLVEGHCYLFDCILTNNRATCGGAVRVKSGGSLEADRCYFGFNAATGDSGAVELLGSSLAVLRNCTFNANHAGNRGGAVGVFSSSELELRHCTLASNTTGSATGAAGLHALSGDARVLNSHFAQNVDGNGLVSHALYDPSVSFTVAGNVEEDSLSTVAGGLIGRPPVLVPKADSPARDAADPAHATPLDALGARRTYHLLPDAGAVEYYGSAYERWISTRYTEEELCDPNGELSVWGPDAPSRGELNNPDFPPMTNGQHFLNYNLPLEQMIENLGGSDYLRVTAYVREEAYRDLNVRLRGSTDLSTWNAVSSTTNFAVPWIGKISALSSLPVTSGGREFFRLEADAMPEMQLLFTAVPDPGNSDDPDLNVGSVAYPFAAGKYEVTIGQWARFLNIADPAGANARELWDARQLIVRDVSAPEGQRYSTGFFAPDLPVNYVSFYGACRFCNWLHNGATAAAALDIGAYDLGSSAPVPANPSGVSRDPDARFVLPTIDEWWKAGCYANGAYSDYPTGLNTPNNNPAPGDAGSMNYSGAGTTLVGAYTDAGGVRSAYDMGGNVAEWSESSPGSVNRFTIGGSYADNNLTVANPFAMHFPGDEKYATVGLRVFRLHR